MDRMVECELARIIINDNAEHQYIFLREKTGERTFPIVISVFEAFAIDRFVKEQRPPRPLTHELLYSILQQLGVTIERTEVTKLEQSTFYANLVLRRGDEKFDVDARPSDAIALAVRSSAPIFVHEDVIDEVASN
jgi:bifunctional DNase/RNase